VAATLLAALVASLVSTPLHAHDSGMGLVRYNPDGRLDESFGHRGVVAERTPQGGLTPEALVIQTDGKTVLVGTSSDLATAAVGFGLARYNPDGTLDSGFGAGGRVLTRVGAATAAAHAVALQPDGDVVVAGSGFTATTGVSNFAVARYTPDGSLDPGFGSGGVVLTPMAASGAEARAIGVQSDGRIVVAGTAFASGTTNDALALARYTADGSPDASFGSSGSVVTTFDPSGSAAEAGSSPVRSAALVIQADGKLVAVGSVGGHQGAFVVARYLPTGDLDSAFGVGGRGQATTRGQASAQAYAAAVQADGNIVVAGGLGTSTDNVAFALARFSPNGDLDASFGSGGFVTTTFDGGGSGAHAVIVEADGKLVAVGSGYAPTPGPPASSGQGAVNGGFAVVRYLPNGTPDTSFGTGGVVLTTVGDAGSMPAGLGVQGDGKLVTAGLTYFLVPTPGVGGLNMNPLVIVPLAGLLILAGAFLARRWRPSTGSG
jgi:uncharacterized delta-60 repeat protein